MDSVGRRYWSAMGRNDNPVRITSVATSPRGRRLAEGGAQVVQHVPSVRLRDAIAEGRHYAAEAVGDHAEEELVRVVRHVVVEVGRLDRQGSGQRTVTAARFAVAHYAAAQED